MTQRIPTDDNLAKNSSITDRTAAIVTESVFEKIRDLAAASKFDEAMQLLDSDPGMRIEDERHIWEISHTLNSSAGRALLQNLLERYLSFNPYSIIVNNMLGDLFRTQGNNIVAKAYFQKALDADPHNFVSLANLALIYQINEETELAITFYKRAIAVSPDDQNILENLRYLLNKTGRLKEFDEYSGNRIDWNSPLFMSSITPLRGAESIIEQATVAILTNGFVILRDAIDTEVLRQFRQAFYNARGNPSAGGHKDQIFKVLDYFEANNIPFTEDIFLSKIVMDILASVFGARPICDPTTTIIRAIGKEDRAAHHPFHQDMRAFGMIGVNVWIPLTQAGGAYPGLELVVGRFKELLEVLDDKERFSGIHIAPGAINEAVSPERLVAPTLAPGDCILFLGDVIHRTYIPEGDFQERVSMELRFYAS